PHRRAVLPSQPVVRAGPVLRDPRDRTARRGRRYGQHARGRAVWAFRTVDGALTLANVGYRTRVTSKRGRFSAVVALVAALLVAGCDSSTSGTPQVSDTATVTLLKTITPANGAVIVDVTRARKLGVDDRYLNGLIAVAFPALGSPFNDPVKTAI